MKLYSIHAGNFKLDGGAMFGIVPKVLWDRVYPSEEDNLCTWAMRCLLVEESDRLILIDNGMGDKQGEKFFSRYLLDREHSLKKSLANCGFDFNDITDVFLTHLHFDHCGGSVEWNRNHTGFEPAFKNAVYWTNKEHWELALNPNSREKGSFLKENIMPLFESGNLKFVEGECELINNFHVKILQGHTTSQMIPQIKCQGKTVVFAADLIPSAAHIPLPWIMSYDTLPLVTLKEKELLLKEAAEGECILFFEHDRHNECCTVKRTEKGVRLDKTFDLKEVF